MRMSLHVSAVAAFPKPGDVITGTAVLMHPMRWIVVSYIILVFYFKFSLSELKLLF